MRTVAVIQARTGSARLPGKVMYPLVGEPMISHVITRVKHSSVVDDVVVATTTKARDGVIAQEANRHGALVTRGDESDVLKRVFNTGREAQADIIVRICCDNPLLSPACIDAVVNRMKEEDTDYVSNNIKRTFPIGLDVEAFTLKSFATVESIAKKSEYREHVTLYYREKSSNFSLDNVTVDEVFAEPDPINSPELRLTLDTSSDYELFKQIYENLSQSRDEIIEVPAAIEYIRNNELDQVNDHISQKPTYKIDE